MAEQWTFEKVEELYKRFNPNAIDGEGKTILVAEDSPPMRAVLVSSIEKKGFNVISAADGLDALKMVRDQTPDCCLLDINLPRISGLDILEAMKRDDNYAKIPVLIVTARKEKRDILIAQKLGVEGYFLKPFKMEDILKRLGEIFAV